MSMAHLPTIMIVAPSAPPLGGGGVTSAHYNLFTLLKKRGFPVSFATFGDWPVSAIQDDVFRFGGSPSLIKLLHLALWPYLKLRGSRRLAYQMADIFAAAPGAIRLNRFLKTVNPDIIVLPDHGAPGLFVTAGKNSRLFLIAHHNPARFTGNPLLGDFCPLDAELAVEVERHVFRKIAGVICPSDYMLNSVIETYGNDRPMTIIPNVVDIEALTAVTKARFDERFDISPEAPVVYLPSAGSKLKGSRFVFEIIRRLSCAYRENLVFYLSGDISSELAEELRHAPANARLLMPGQLPYHEHLSLVKGCSFGVSPTLIDNFSMALLEAGYCGLPMVAFDVGGTGEIIVDGENGFLVPYLDIEMLISKSMLLLDRQSRSLLFNNIQDFLNLRFNQDDIVDQFLHFVGVECP